MRRLIFITGLSCYALLVCRLLVFLSAQIHRESNNWLCDKTTSARFTALHRINSVLFVAEILYTGHIPRPKFRGWTSVVIWERKVYIGGFLRRSQSQFLDKDQVQKFTRDYDHIWSHTIVGILSNMGLQPAAHQVLLCGPRPHLPVMCILQKLRNN